MGTKIVRRARITKEQHASLRYLENLDTSYPEEQQHEKRHAGLPVVDLKHMQEYQQKHHEVIEYKLGQGRGWAR